MEIFLCNAYGKQWRLSDSCYPELRMYPHDRSPSGLPWSLQAIMRYCEQSPKEVAEFYNAPYRKDGYNRHFLRVMAAWDTEKHVLWEEML